MRLSQGNVAQNERDEKLLMIYLPKQPLVNSIDFILTSPSMPEILWQRSRHHMMQGQAPSVKFSGDHSVKTFDSPGIETQTASV